jgi:hemerythrin superfamily protein
MGNPEKATRGNKRQMKINAFELLKQDHQKVKDLFEEFDAAPDIVTKQHIVEQVIKELTLHSEVEEELFYPAVREASEEANDLVDEAIDEHQTVRAIIEELQGIASSDAGYDEKFHELAENVVHHAEEEESEIFPAAQQGETGETDWEQLGSQMQTRKQKLQDGVQGQIPAKTLR